MLQILARGALGTFMFAVVACGADAQAPEDARQKDDGPDSPDDSTDDDSSTNDESSTNDDSSDVPRTPTQHRAVAMECDAERPPGEVTYTYEGAPCSEDADCT